MRIFLVIIVLLVVMKKKNLMEFFSFTTSCVAAKKRKCNAARLKGGVDASGIMNYNLGSDRSRMDGTAMDCAKSDDGELQTSCEKYECDCDGRSYIQENDLACNTQQRMANNTKKTCKRLFKGWKPGSKSSSESESESESEN